MESNNDLIKQIKRYQYNIQQVNPPENDPQRVLYYVRKLSKLPIKYEELEKTGVGKTVNALRKRDGDLGEEATMLVAKWKDIVKKQFQEEEDTDKCDDSHSDYESPGSDAGSEKPTKETKKIRVEVQKVEEKPKDSKLKSSKNSAPSVTTHRKDSSDRKRKRSPDGGEKHKKTKHLKLEPKSSEEEVNSEPEIRKEVSSSKPVNKIVDHLQLENDRKKKRDKHEDRKSQKKPSKHHKHKDDKHHKHHSKRSHSDRKDSESKDRNRMEKKSESKSSSSSKKDYKFNKNYSDDEPSGSYVNHDDSDSDEKFTVKVENNQADNDFGAALLGISDHVSASSKKKSTPTKYSSVQSSPSLSSPRKSGTDLNLLSETIKLEPLDIEEYLKPEEDFYSHKENSVREKTSYRLKHVTEEEAMNSMVTTKNLRTKVFSGMKSKFVVKFPTLFELCVRVLQDNFDALEYTGGVPYDVLKPILEKVTVEQLFTFEEHNQYLIGETDELWEFHAKKHFRNAKRQEYETWRDLYLRCVDEREEKLQSLTENISQSIANSTPVRKTKLAYLDTTVKPPRNVARSQAKHGTGNNLSINKSSKGPQPSPAAVQSVKERLARESLAAPAAVSIPTKNLLGKKKKAPLMQKTLQLFKGLKR